MDFNLKVKRSLVLILRITLLFILINTYITNAQTSKIDSLENVLAKHPALDTTKVNLLNDLAFLYYRSDIKKTAKYLEISKSLADSLNYEKGQAGYLYVNGMIQVSKSNLDAALKEFNKAYLTYESINSPKSFAKCFRAMAIVYYQKDDYDQAVTYAKKAIEQYKIIGDKQRLAGTLNILAAINTEIGKNEEAEEQYNKALEITKKTGDDRGIANIYNNLATLYHDRSDYPRALEYHHKSIVISEKIGDSLGKAKSLNNIGIMCRHQEKYDKAISYYKRSMILMQQLGNKRGIAQIKGNIGVIYKTKGEYSKAIKYFKEGLKISESINNVLHIGVIYSNLGSVYTLLKEYELALDYYKKALQLRLKINNKRGIAISYQGIGEVYYFLKEYDKALKNILESEKIALEIKQVDIQNDNNELLSNIYYQMKDYKKSITHHRIFKTLNDSIYNQDNIRKLTEVEYKYKYQKELDEAKIKQITLTKRVEKIDKNLAISQKQTLWAVIGVLILGIMLGGGILMYRIKNIRSINQNILIEQKLLRSQMTPHFMFNSLSVLQGIILNKESKKAITYLSKFSKLLRITLENSRDKIVSLKNELQAIENYLVVQNLGAEIPYQYTIKIADQLDEKAIWVPPMMIQPFVENAIEHAFHKDDINKQINISLKFEGHQLICIIEDNGIGIESKVNKEFSKKKSLATTITKERLQMLAKEFKVETNITIQDKKYKQQKGTTVTLTLPYKK
ncbi:tetratricopeptide repeat-containing sensor histidine kinase [Aquimarina litoralis]|uniref:tetratricopeptide repeat-containing sensor histidine kinase n=1 Tax=Aquimarina litoralis TaxID=584605 RepID=UPI001C57B65E|nr:tetratricopeptide repeat protein [Aquimarina litoralis]MBW1297363.1 tetratricopeptide repeat protein [Aquimarina litoralis]